MSWITIDFETRSRCDLAKAGAYRYAADFSTEVLCLAYETETGSAGVWSPGHNSNVLRGAIENDSVRFIAHNAAFEREIWKHHMVPLGWPELPLERWGCTMARANQLALPGALDKLLAALRAPVEVLKDKDGARLTKSLSRWKAATKKKPAGWAVELTPEVLARVRAYCEQDIRGEVWVHRVLGELPEYERENWLLTQRMNDRGVGIDLELVRAMQRIVDEATAPLAARFEELTGGLRFGQIAKVRAWCEEQGVALPNLSKQTLVELLGDGEEDEDEPDGGGDPDDDAGPELKHVELPAHVEEALRIRQLVGSASIKKLHSMEACVGFDHRARGLLIYHGTGPGRQTARLLQPHNFPKGSNEMQEHDPAVKVTLIMQGDAELLEMTIGPPVETVVASLRHCLVAAPGHVYASGDYSGIQARTVLALAGQADKTHLMASGQDVYCDMATQIFKYPVFKHSHPRERGIGKNSVLGLGFQMGPPTFQEKYARDRSLSFCEGVVETYREQWAPLVPKLWYGLQAAAVDEVWYGGGHEHRGILYERVKVGGVPFLRATIHNGTAIYYAYPEQQISSFVSKYDGLLKERRAFTYWVQKEGRWQQQWAFGGQLTENVVMKIEREIMETAKKRLDAAGFPMVLEVHDEAIGEPRKDPDMDLFRHVMEDVEPWVRDLGIPIQVDVWTGPRYKK